MPENNTPITQTAKQLIDMACAYSDVSTAELARRLGLSRQVMHSRLKAGRFTCAEWQDIASALGAEVKITIEFPDGKKIE